MRFPKLTQLWEDRLELNGPFAEELDEARMIGFDARRSYYSPATFARRLQST
jgi:hypothetical protein